MATSGPTVRPVWFLWEDGAFWRITGDWSNLRHHLAADDRIAICIEETNLATGSVK